MTKPTPTPAAHPVNPAGCYLPDLGSTWQPAPRQSGLALAVVPDQEAWKRARIPKNEIRDEEGIAALAALGRLWAR